MTDRPGGDGWPSVVDGRLDALRAAGRWRSLRPLDAAGPNGALGPDGQVVTTFASNDYLGLSTHPRVVADAHRALDRWGAGATASRLVVGSRPVHHDLEIGLAEWKGTEGALVFPTGYAANLGVLSALAGPGTRIVSDALNHASIVDGCRLARAETVVVAHRDLDAVERALTVDDRPCVVVTDTVFSMDGDVADVDALAEICTRHRALLVLDEAHEVLGHGIDPAAHPDLALVRVGTLSKALGSLGGFVATSGPVRDLLVNTARTQIFTTGLAPADAAAALAALDIVTGPEGDHLRARLRRHVDRLVPGHPSPIVPVIVGEERAAVAAAAALLNDGLLVPAIRPPTVPDGTSRLRVTVSAAHTDADVDRLVAGLASHTPWRPPDPAATEPGRKRAPGARETDPVRGGDPAATEPGRKRAPGARETDPVREMARPDTLVAVIGTGTEVGKTWAGARLLAALRTAGHRVAARKPAQSAEPDDPGPGDAEVLAAATGEDPLAVCPAHRRYPVAMAPPMAATAAGLPPFTVADLVDEVRWPDGVDVGLVETAGGAASPAADDGDALDLVAALAPDLVVLVADAGLGTLNGVALTVAAVDRRWPVVVLLNRFDPDDDLHRANLAWLREREGLDVVVDVEALITLVVPDG